MRSTLAPGDPSPSARLRMTIAALALLAACRTTRPPNAEPITPLTAMSAADAAQQLAVRRSQFRGERTLIRLRMPSASARGQLQVDGSGRMLLTIYTPLGTTAARLYAEGDEVTFLNDFDSSAWRGKPADLAGGFGFFGANMAPAAVALLLVGLPPSDLQSIAYAPTGMQQVRFSDLSITYDPPVYPPKRVVIDRGDRRVEIDHLESYLSEESLKRLEIPRNYRCCVLPR